MVANGYLCLAAPAAPLATIARQAATVYASNRHVLKTCGLESFCCSPGLRALNAVPVFCVCKRVRLVPRFRRLLLSASGHLRLEKNAAFDGPCWYHGMMFIPIILVATQKTPCCCCNCWHVAGMGLVLESEPNLATHLLLLHQYF